MKKKRIILIFNLVRSFIVKSIFSWIIYETDTANTNINLLLKVETFLDDFFKFVLLETIISLINDFNHIFNWSVFSNSVSNSLTT